MSWTILKFKFFYLTQSVYRSKRLYKWLYGKAFLSGILFILLEHAIRIINEKKALKIAQIMKKNNYLFYK